MSSPTQVPVPSGRSATDFMVRIRGTQHAFPSVCMCCGESTPRTQTVSGYRTVQRVKKTTSWQVPACEACSKHIEGFVPPHAGWAQWRGTPMPPFDPAALDRKPIAVVGMALWALLAGGALGTLAAVALRHALGAHVSPILGGGIFVLGTPLLFGMAYLRSNFAVAKKKRDGEANHARNAAARAANEAAATEYMRAKRPGCVHTEQGVILYVPGETEHSFHFARRDYASAYAAANAGIVVEKRL